MAFCGQGSGNSLELNIWGGTIVDYIGFDAKKDCEKLKDAMKGLGADEDVILRIVAQRSNSQRQELKTQFAMLYGKELTKELKSELVGNFEDAILALFRETDEFDAWCLNDAMDGIGTNEKTLIEIMCTRTNEELKRITEAYKKIPPGNLDLAAAMKSETSGNFQNLLHSLVQAQRPESKVTFFAFWNYWKAKRDARALYRAGEKRWGTDETKFHKILTTKSPGHLEMVFGIYEKLTKKTMEESIKSEMSGPLEDGMLAIVKCAKDKIGYFAECLYESMKGAGTNDKTLIRIMVSRSERDLIQIKTKFESKYGKSLENFIKDDCSGDYKKLLVHLCRGNSVV